MIFRDALKLFDDDQILNIFGDTEELAHHVRADAIESDEYLRSKVVEKMFPMYDEKYNSVLVIYLETNDVNFSQVLDTVGDNELVEVWDDKEDVKLYEGVKQNIQHQFSTKELRRVVSGVQEYEDYDGLKLSISLR